MKEIKREVSKEQIVYEITKEELEEIKAKERNKGRADVFNYFIFSIKNYKYKLNIKGVHNLCENIIEFLAGSTNMIENTYRYSFNDFMNYMKNEPKYKDLDWF